MASGPRLGRALEFRRTRRSKVLMADKEIVVYIEGEGGGGTTGKRHYLDGEFRKAWKEFLQPLADRARQRGIWKFRCIPGRGGSATGKQFANPLPEDAGALRIL